MSGAPWHRGAASAESAARRQLEGEERLGLLSAAEFMAVTVGGALGSPSVVFIGWSQNLVEQAYPGTAIWRAALERFLRTPPTADPGNTLVRRAALDSLNRFTTLERWLAWSDHERDARPTPPVRNSPAFWISGP